MMNTVENNRLILVPCDFSPLAYHAMGHGAYMSKAMNSRLLILHVVNRDADVTAVEKKLCFVAEECFEKFGVRPEVMIRQGNQPYSVIKAVTKELNPMLVVLKTGGGVYTVTILSGTSSPFLVVQGPPKSNAVNHISFPINFLNPHDEKLKRVVLFSDYYPDAVMHIITPSGKGTPKERNISTNLTLMAKVMQKQGIKTNFITHDQKKNAAETILELSKGMDMIVIQMEEVSSLNKFFFGLREEKLIINVDKIPVLCFNRESDLVDMK
jgi:nucleotide-binding universal stress UspA family protein